LAEPGPLVAFQKRPGKKVELGRPQAGWSSIKKCSVI